MRSTNPPPRRTGVAKAPRLNRKTMTTLAAMAGRVSGKVMRQKISVRLAPRVRAASLSEPGDPPQNAVHREHRERQPRAHQAERDPQLVVDQPDRGGGEPQEHEPPIDGPVVAQDQDQGVDARHVDGEELQHQGQHEQSPAPRRHPGHHVRRGVAEEQRHHRDVEGDPERPDQVGQVGGFADEAPVVLEAGRQALRDQGGEARGQQEQRDGRRQAQQRRSSSQGSHLLATLGAPLPDPRASTPGIPAPRAVLSGSGSPS